MKLLVNARKPANDTSSDNGTSYCVWREVTKHWSTLEIFDYVLTGPLLTCIITAGVAGNVLCMLTFSKFWSKLKIYRHLLTLALWDTFYITTSFFLYNLPTLIYGDIMLHGRYVAVNPYLYYLSSVARTGSIWTILVIAVDRYLALCHPFRFAEVNTERRFTIVFIFVGLASYLYGLPRFFEVTIVYCHELITDQPVPRLKETSMRSSYVYWLMYRVVGGSVFYSVVPFFTLLLLTVRILMELKRMGRFLPVPDTSVTITTEDSNHSPMRRSPQSHHSRNHQNNHESCNNGSSDKINHWMHVSVITMFLICHSFPSILDVWEFAQPSLLTEKKWTNRHALMSHAAILLATLNGSCNFYIYYLSSYTFRKDCKKSVSRFKPY